MKPVMCLLLLVIAVTADWEIKKEDDALQPFIAVLIVHNNQSVDLVKVTENISYYPLPGEETNVVVSWTAPEIIAGNEYEMLHLHFDCPFLIEKQRYSDLIYEVKVYYAFKDSNVQRPLSPDVYFSFEVSCEPGKIKKGGVMPIVWIADVMTHKWGGRRVSFLTLSRDADGRVYPKRGIIYP